MALRFGAFVPPFHHLGEDPSFAFWRDLDLVRWLDELGYDEAWVGEHHSGGWQLLSSPEVFLAAAAERTRRIRLGTGVVSVPYHHPLMVSNRIAQLDHMTRGRVMLGMGAGVSPADAHMLGIEPADQRRMMAEAVEAITALLQGDEPVTRRTDWFELRDARPHLGTFQRPCLEMAIASAGSERGMRLAGRFGHASLNFAGRPGLEEPPLDGLWAAAEESAEQHGQTVDRRRWRVAICAHVAETREQAFAEAGPGMARWFHDYVRGTTGARAELPAGRELQAAAEAGTAIIGSPDDAVEAIERMLADSGGFGTLLVNVQDWAPRAAVKRSFELIAQEVMPRFSGRLDAVRASNAWVASSREELAAKAREAAQRAALELAPN